MKQRNTAVNWLLDSVVSFQFPLDLLLHKDLETHLNRKGHGLGEVELIAILYRMFSDGLLFAETGGRNGESVRFSPTSEEIKAALHWIAKMDIYYGLTQEGGSLWESVANPRWNKFIYGSSDSDSGEFISMNLNRARRAFREETRSCQTSCSINNPLWEVLSPWQATYWKTLPRGHRVSYTTTFFSDEEIERLQQQETPAMFRQRHLKERK